MTEIKRYRDTSQFSTIHIVKNHRYVYYPWESAFRSAVLAYLSGYHDDHIVNNLQLCAATIPSKVQVRQKSREELAEYLFRDEYTTWVYSGEICFFKFTTFQHIYE